MSNTDAHQPGLDLHAGEQPITIREAVAADRDALERLAELDSARPLAAGDPEFRSRNSGVVLGEVGGEVHAAHAVDERRTIANPFRRTAELVVLVELHARRGRKRRRSVAPQPPGFGIGLLPPRRRRAA